MRALVLSVFIMLIQGCASTQGIVSKEVAGKSKIFVVSQLDNVFNYQKAGTTAFQNLKLTTKVDQWEINSHVESTVVKQLKEFYRPASGGVMRSKLSIPSDNYLTGYSNSMTDENGLNALKEEGFDYVLFITPVKFQDAYFETNQYIEGYGIYLRNFFGSEKKIVYSQISFTLFDVSTGNFLASNGDTSANGGDSVWITHKNIKLSKDVSSVNQLKEIVANHKSDILELTNSLTNKSLKYMGFQVSK